MTLWITGDQVEAYKLNKMAEIGLDEDKGTPSTIGQAFIAMDTLIVYVSLDGVEWTHKFLLVAV